jgi:hypothetical protein
MAMVNKIKIIAIIIANRFSKPSRLFSCLKVTSQERTYGSSNQLDSTEVKASMLSIV